MSIPRLELTAAVMAVRLVCVVKRAMPAPPAHVWYFTDSSAVLGRLRGCAGELEVYKGMRLAEIQNKTELAQWMWVPEQANPTDWLTRTALRVEDIGKSSLYQVGLKWMCTHKQDWLVRDSLTRKLEGEGDKGLGTVNTLSTSQCSGLTVLALSASRHSTNNTRPNTFPVLAT